MEDTEYAVSVEMAERIKAAAVFLPMLAKAYSRGLHESRKENEWMKIQSLLKSELKALRVLVNEALRVIG